MNGWRLRLFVGVERLLARLGLKLPGKIMYIGGSDTLPPPLSRDEEAELIARLDGGDEGVKSQLIERNLRLVVYIARRFENTGVGIEDLISIGTIGLIKAINTYQPAKNIKLATYASRCIENEILMHLRKTANLKSEVSFDEPLNTDWDGNELLLSDILGTESDLVMKPIEADVDRQLLSDALEKLEDREREIITLRFGLDGRPERTQKEVADRLGISSTGRPAQSRRRRPGAADRPDTGPAHGPTVSAFSYQIPQSSDKMCSLISLAPCLTSATATQMIHATVVSMRPMLRCLWGRMFSLISA